MGQKIDVSISDLDSTVDFVKKMTDVAMAENNFIKVVRVDSVDTANLTVTITPLVNIQTTDGELVQHSQIYNAKYYRMQSGGSAIIIDPTVGDIGLALICDEDYSTVKETGDFSPPSTLRRHSLSDSIYLGGILNQTPSQYIRFDGSGIAVYSPIQINIEAPSINAKCENLTAEVEETTKIDSKDITLWASESVNLYGQKINITGQLSMSGSGSQTAKINMPIESTSTISASGISLTEHTHGGVEKGDDSTGKPK